MPEMLAPPEAPEAARAYWTGRLSASIAYFLSGQVDKSHLRDAYREFLRSPACSPELRATVRDVYR